MGGVVSKTVEITTSSGNVDLALADVPEAVMDTVSGKITTTLSAGGAELQYISDRGTLLTDRGYEQKGDLYISHVVNITKQTAQFRAIVFYASGVPKALCNRYVTGVPAVLQDAFL